ncbi:unnamed protein product [Polarella glacialis]|uniref:Uncharacterized protein n=1 Tax=Polarella glacialis TaxID=89957 RepID=A0A813KJD9_POLGL|nr:unnamed protein product [Polarella glacialis]
MKGFHTFGPQLADVLQTQTTTFHGMKSLGPAALFAGGNFLVKSCANPSEPVALGMSVLAAFGGGGVPAGIPQTNKNNRIEAVGSSEAVVRAMAAAAVGQTAASASAESELRRRTACSGMSASDEGFAPESPKQDDQMAELRRARQELWAKRKSESMLSGDVDGESVENSSPSKP